MKDFSATYFPNSISKKGFFYCWSVATLILLVSGCASIAPKEQIVDDSVQTIWPSPPEQPRIQYVGSLRNEQDVTGKGLSFIDRLLGRSPKDESLLTKPYGVYSDSNGKVYVTDVEAKVVVFDSANKQVTYMGQSGPGTLKIPLGITVDLKGNVYVSDGTDKRIVKFDANGHFVKAFGGSGIIDSPAGLAFDEKSQMLYVVDVKKHQIIVFNESGDVAFTVGENGQNPGQFYYPTNISMDLKKNMFYIADTLNFRVQGFNMDGTAVNTFGQNGDGPGDFTRLKGIGVDTEGHIYAVDSAFNNFQIFNDKGQLLLAVGRASAREDGFSLPAGAHVDRNNHIFIADQFNRRIQMFKYLGDTSDLSE